MSTQHPTGDLDEVRIDWKQLVILGVVAAVVFGVTQRAAALVLRSGEVETHHVEASNRVEAPR